MFKAKKIKPLPTQYKEAIEEEEIEDEESEEELDEEEIEEEAKALVKTPAKKSAYSVGDILPVQQVVGYQVVKSIDKSGMPSVISTESMSEAEILSFIYQQ